MCKQISKLLFVSILLVSLLVPVAHVQAQSPALSPGIKPVSLRQQPIGFDPTSNIVTWDTLGQEEIRLTGPFDSAYILFGLPADWKLTSGARLNLVMNIAISTGIEGEAPTDMTGRTPYFYNSVIGGGTLEVVLNNTSLGVLPLDETGEVTRDVPIPIDAFVSDRTDGRMIVRFILNSEISCYTYDKMNLTLRTSSYFELPHESVLPPTDLVSFPRPIYQNSFIPDTAIVVVPDKPSAGELQAALSVAAGLGNLTAGALTLDLVSVSKLTPEQTASNHLIFVGKSASMSTLEQVQLPLPIKGGKLAFSGDNSTDDGVVEMINSPWSSAHVALLVSGNTDKGVIKSAQAVSTGVLRPNASTNLAIVKEVQTVAVQVTRPVDQTLADLGYQGNLFQNRGTNFASYSFYIPPGWTVAPDAYFELVFGHSELLDYNRSGVVILLNGKPIGSIRLSDATGSQSTNSIQINIPAIGVVPGTNLLDVRANLIPYDDCTPLNMRGLWVNIWPSSKLHLPIHRAQVNPVSILGLASYPAPFIFNPELGDTAFVLPHNDLDAWRAAVQIANQLGFNANGSIFTLATFYENEMPEAEREKYNLLVIGQPSQMTIVKEMNEALPAPFLEGSNVPVEKNFQVTYRIPPDSPMGYVEMMASPWNTDKIVLAVLGHTAQGLGWAAASLVDATLRSELSGNFAVVNNQQIITSDTRLFPTVNVDTTTTTGEGEQGVSITPPIVKPTPAAAERPAWILPTLFALLGLMVLILVVVFVRSRSRTRTNQITQK